MDVRRAGAEQHPVRVLQHAPFQHLAVPNGAGVDVQLVVLAEQVQRPVHQIRVQRVAAEAREHHREVVRQQLPFDRLGREPLSRVDEHGEIGGLQSFEHVRIGESVVRRHQCEPVEPVVVGVLLDVVGAGVVILTLRPEVPKRRNGVVTGVPWSVESGERDERTVDGEPGDGVVRAEVAPPGRTTTGARDGADHAGLMHLALQPLRRDVSAVRCDGRLVGVERGVNVDDPEPVFQPQHRSTRPVHHGCACRSAGGRNDARRPPDPRTDPRRVPIAFRRFRSIESKTYI